MAFPPLLPSLPGLSWSVHKKPTFSTRVAPHTSGREVRVGLYTHTIYEFELGYDGLDSGGKRSALQLQSLQTLMGFFILCQGQLNTFLYEDPSDHSVASQVIGTGDGVTTSFVASRTLGLATEPVSYLTSMTGVFTNGAAVSGAAIVAPNIIQLASAPVTGAVVTASYQYSFNCRFTDDQLDFENILKHVWAIKSVKFRSVR